MERRKIITKVKRISDEKIDPTSALSCQQVNKGKDQGAGGANYQGENGKSSAEENVERRAQQSKL